MLRTNCPLLNFAEKREITLNGQTIPYIIKRSARAKHVRLEIRREANLTVVIPKSYKIGGVTNLLKSKEDWILDKLTKCGEIQPFSAQKELDSGDTIPYLGQHLVIVKQQDHSNTDNVKLEQNTLVVSLRSANGRLSIVLEQWYRMQAAKLIKERADELSAQLGLTYNLLVIRGQRTRWGSCSQKGNLSINWKLMMAPEPVIDYIIIHELAHLKEMNHTKRFWKLVAEHCPGWREHRKWLKDHEAELAAKLPI